MKYFISRNLSYCLLHKIKLTIVHVPHIIDIHVLFVCFVCEGEKET